MLPQLAKYFSVKNLVIFILFILLISGCALSKTPFDLTPNKKFIGDVTHVTITHGGYGMGYTTFVETDLPESFVINVRVKIKTGTPCYVYYEDMGTKIYVVWKNARKVYQIH
jgi:hypothetical protein